MKNFVFVILFFLHLSFGLSELFAEENKQLDSLNSIINNPVSSDVKLASAYLALSDILPDDTMFYFCSKAKEIAEQALKKSPSSKEKKLLLASLSGAFINLGYAYDYKGDALKAINYYIRALRIKRDYKDKKGEAVILNNIGFVYNNQGDIPKALEYYNKSLKIKESLDDKKGMATTLNNIGAIYEKQGDFTKTVEYYNRSLNIYNEIADESGIAWSLNNIATSFYNQGDISKALKYYNKSLALKNKLGEKSSVAWTLNNIGTMYYKQGDYVKALTFYKKALAILEEMDNKEGVSWSYSNIGNIMLIKNKLNEAQSYLYKSLIIAEEIKYPASIRDASELLSQVLEKQGKAKEAFAMFKLFIKMRDSINNEKNLKSIALQEAKYKYEKQKTIDDLEHEKRLAIDKKEKDRQQVIIYASIAGLILLVIFLFFVFNRLRITNQHKKLIELQKQEVIRTNEELYTLNDDLNQRNEEIITQRDKIEKQKTLVEEINQQVSESIDYATRLQKSILPDVRLLAKYFSDYFVLFKPKDKVSGDFYWWAHVEECTVVTAADSTGHGVPGAFMSMLGASLLREIVQKEYITHTGVILRKLRKEIIKALKQKGETGEQKDGMDMAIISIDNRTNILQYSGANNPLYIITESELEVLNPTKYPMDRVKEILLENTESKLKFYEIKPDKMPISIYERMDKFSVCEIQLKKGDQLYMFSDGYVDQFGGPKGKKMKYKIFRKILLDNSNKEMKVQKQSLEENFYSWKGNLSQVDDLVVLGIKI